MTTEIQRQQPTNLRTSKNWLNSFLKLKGTSSIDSKKKRESSKSNSRRKSSKAMTTTITTTETNNNINNNHLFSSNVENTNFKLEIKVLDPIIYIQNHPNDLKSKLSKSPQVPKENNLKPIRGVVSLTIYKKNLSVQSFNISFKGVEKFNSFENKNSKHPNSNNSKHTHDDETDGYGTGEFDDNEKFVNYGNDTINWTGSSVEEIITDQCISFDEIINSQALLPGTYSIPFEFFADSKFPESINFECAEVSYRIESILELKNEYNSHSCSYPINIIKSLPTYIYHNNNEIIAIGIWRNLLRYQLSLSNKHLIIGQPICFSVKLMPILKDNYAIHTLKINLIQNIEYHSASHKNFKNSKANNNKKKISNFVKTEKIPLRYYKLCDSYLKKYLESDGTFKINCDLILKDEYLSKALDERFKIYPNTELDNNDGSKLSITHQIKLGIVVEEIETSTNISSTPSFLEPFSSLISSTSSASFANNSYSQEIIVPNSGISTANSNSTGDFTRTRSTSISRKTASESDILDEWLIESARPMVESSSNNNKRIELALFRDVLIFNSKSEFGSIPPPKYSESCDHFNSAPFNFENFIYQDNRKGRSNSESSDFSYLSTSTSVSTSDSISKNSEKNVDSFPPTYDENDDSQKQSNPPDYFVK
ncbi:hypothetical protein BVG19_g5493 [[Candida] boidinii]|nr:hypothetical protein BVG19_g5493 [[Candida] boidinii]OWB49985.1 hypothetical protein B5S27_g1531 [[Candida] boidinii]